MTCWWSTLEMFVHLCCLKCRTWCGRNKCPNVCPSLRVCAELSMILFCFNGGSSPQKQTFPHDVTSTQNHHVHVGATGVPASSAFKGGVEMKNTCTSLRQGPSDVIQPTSLSRDLIAGATPPSCGFLVSLQPVLLILASFSPFKCYSIYIQETFNTVSPLSHRVYHQHTINRTLQNKYNNDQNKLESYSTGVKMASSWNSELIWLIRCVSALGSLPV